MGGLNGDFGAAGNFKTSQETSLILTAENERINGKIINYHRPINTAIHVLPAVGFTNTSQQSDDQTKLKST